MNKSKLTIINSLLILVILVVGGVVYLNGQANSGVTGAFPEDCVGCHGDTPDFPLFGAKEGYWHSGHWLGFEHHTANASYANGDGCQQCHTHEGFVAHLKTGQTPADSFIKWPSQPGCFSCHAPHETGDFALRTNNPVTLANSDTVNLGKGNLCANCHQSRNDPKTFVEAMPATEIRSHWGPHHGPQANLVAGTGAYEFSGKQYGTSPHTKVIKDSCVSCHMALPDGRYSLSSAFGGHSFNLRGEVHGQEKLNLASCQSCHKAMTQVQEGDHLYFGYQAKEDWDQDGKLESAQQEVVGLLEHLVNTNGTGLLQKLTPAMFDDNGEWNQIRDKSVMRSQPELAALYNYKMIMEDRSQGVHNLTYSIQILYDSIAALDADFDASHRPK